MNELVNRNIAQHVGLFTFSFLNVTFCILLTTLVQHTTVIQANVLCNEAFSNYFIKRALQLIKWLLVLPPSILIYIASCVSYCSGSFFFFFFLSKRCCFTVKNIFNHFAKRMFLRLSISDKTQSAIHRDAHVTL